jgi:prepilin-type N-terminal cleavage/methylation domain-containing protein
MAPSDDGFTLVELLIVIIVIGILAVLAIVSYNGVAQKAHASLLKNDLSQSASQLSVARTESTNDQWPQSSTGTLTPSNGDTLSYNVSADGTQYCVMASGWGISYFITDSNTAPQVGICNGTVGIVGTVPTGYVVSTLAGTAGVTGATNGTGANASFNMPTALATDSAGNLYVADSGNNCIREVTPSGVVSTFAGTCGTGTAGINDGTGASAQFTFPVGLTIDSSGLMYVTDNENCIRKVTTAAVVTTFVGDCGVGVGRSNGTGRAAQFYIPVDTALDSSNNLYVADFDNQCIREVDQTATTSYFAGNCGNSAGSANGTGTAAQFRNPYGVKFDSTGNLYVTEYGNNCIRKITPAAVVTTFVGTCGTSTAGISDGTGASAKFNGPQGLVFDSWGNMIVVDNQNNCIRRVTPAGVVTTVAGSCGSSTGSTDGNGTSARFNNPNDIAIDPSGNIYVTDSGNTIRKLTPHS